MEFETIPNGAPSESANTETVKTEATATGVAEKATGLESTQRGNENTEAKQQTITEKHRIKYGKTERELTVDELKMMAQKGWAADDRFQEAARIRKETEELVKKANWDKLIEKQTGKSALEFYKEKLKAEIARMKMTPEEKELEDKRREVEALRAEEEQIKAARLEEQVAAREKQYAEQWDKELTEAIESEGLPKTRYAIQRAVQIASKVNAMGLDPDWRLCVREAKNQLLEDTKGFFASAKDENALIALLGEDLAMRVSKALVNRKQPQAPQRKAVDATKGDNFRQKETKPVDMDVWIASRRKKFEEG